MTRRDFLIGGCGAAAASLVSGCEVEGIVRTIDRARVKARLGVLANVGLVRSPSAQKTLEKALRYYREQDVAAVAVADRLTRRDVFDDAWHRVFGYSSGVRLVCAEGPAEVGGFAFAVSFAKPTRKAAEVTFYGEERLPLTDDLAFFDAAYRSVYAGSMGGFSIPGGYVWGGRRLESRTEVKSAQGLLVSAYADDIEIRRLDFTQTGPVVGRPKKGETYAEDVAPRLVLSRKEPWRREAAAAPEFWSDTVLQVIPGYDSEGRVLKVKWPNLQRRYTGRRAFGYEVTASLAPKEAGESPHPFRRWNVLSDKYYLAEERDAASVACSFRDKDFELVRDGGAKVIIAVTPIDAHGNRGKPLQSGPFRP